MAKNRTRVQTYVPNTPGFSVIDHATGQVVETGELFACLAALKQQAKASLYRNEDKALLASIGSLSTPREERGPGWWTAARRPRSS